MWEMWSVSCSFPSRLHKGRWGHMLYSNHYLTRQLFLSHIDLFAIDRVCQVNLQSYISCLCYKKNSTRQTLAVMPSRCVLLWNTHLHPASFSTIIASQSESTVPVIRGSERDTRVVDVQGEEIGSREEWRGEKESEMEGWIRNSVRLYLRGWVPAPAGCQTGRWCPRCWSYHPPLPACAPAGHIDYTNTIRGCLTWAPWL